jgi:hypothetical protein
LNPPKQEVEKETDYREACESGRYLPPAYRRMKTNPRRGGEGDAKSRIRRRTELGLRGSFLGPDLGRVESGGVS